MAEFPSYLGIAFTVEKVGRKSMVVCGALMAAVASTLLTFVHENQALQVWEKKGGRGGDEEKWVKGVGVRGKEGWEAGSEGRGVARR